ncbi:CPBP family intramembrane metalloprotease domain-containing protein [Flagellimonas aquimarina]|uniref:CPBP family intramembrane metalloprotease domain-containing protein n=1 Tax=Flagellimonas aquimarina TaxID=2201895 RepID=A0A316KXV8_9FLAO|nr:CPBP family intramembrane glutamic endopeptidase [Allomuricauda koreensis]PWL39077.1 CPBP family intramembrane metalloprotease domain-containing protein [Allomuricauda koreensis]
MYVEQGYKGTLGLWKYFIFPVGFIGLMVLNYLIIQFLDIDVEALIRSEIERKGTNRFLVESILPLIVGLLLLLLWVKYVHQQSISSLTTSRKKVDWKRISFAFGIWGVITILLTAADIYFSPDNYVLNFNLTKFIPLAIIAILLIPLQTSFEEYLFRGHMMQGLGIMAKNRWLPLIVTSVLFGLMHIANPEVDKLGYGIMIYYIGTGFFLGILTLMDEGLELALGFHAANNLITALLVTADWTAFQTDSIYLDISEPVLGWDVLIPVFVLYPILLLIFSRKYGWKNWKDKLFGKVLTKDEFVALNKNESNLA